MKIALTSVSIIFFSWYLLHSQNTLKLHLIDANSGEALIGAVIINKLNQNVYLTNNFGFSLIPAPSKSDSIPLLLSYFGYHDSLIWIFTSDSILKVALIPKLTLIDEVYVRGYSKNPAHGLIQLSAAELNRTPFLLAEKDVLKSIQSLPGIQQNREGSSNFSVRGGNADQNLILIDGIPVYNINHLFGFVSVISPDAVNQASFFKGGIPARLGNRLSSVLDITLREGNKNHLTGSLGIGILSVKATIEGPLRAKNGSFLIAARRTPYDLILAPISTLGGNRIGYYYQDLVSKINFPINKHNALFISAYLGSDKIYRAEFAIEPQNLVKYRTTWGNITSAIRWTNNSLDNTLSNFTFAFTRYRYLKDTRAYNKLLFGKQTDYLGFKSNINNIIIKENLEYTLATHHQINFGIENVFHIFNLGTNRTQNADTAASIGNTLYHNETNAFVEHIFKYKIITSTIGLRSTLYHLKNKSHLVFQPRILLELKISDATSVSASYNRMYQFLHLYANSTIGLPNDLWIPVSMNIPPASANQFAAGLKTSLKNISISSEVFFKTMQNVTDYRDGVILNNNFTNWDEVLSVGKGFAYGVEWLLDYHLSKINTSIAYAYTRSFRKHPDIKQGNWFPYTYDRPHNININLQWKLMPNKHISANWMYASGYMITVSEGNFFLGGYAYPDLSNRNNFRTPPIHHLDIAYSASKQKKRGTQTWSFGIYNVYARTNPFGYIYNITDLDNNALEKPTLQFVSLFNFVPFIAYEFKFY
ncbi:MAG: TonB-dependent receptor plug domain-containing protein [Bacteroidales bacterium]|nr:TonB-dependent receptor plug domain-containing protein [Bacteroidales bacterium]